MKTKKLLLLSLLFVAGTLSAQNYQVPVSEQDEPMMQGKFQPTWESLSNYKVPEWFRNVKFVFGLIGDLNAWKEAVIGWLVICIWKIHENIGIM
mgnify:CR=1 FL=1